MGKRSSNQDRPKSKNTSEILHFDTSEIKMEEVKNYLRKAKRRKAPGPNEIPLEFYKEMDDEHLQEIIHEMNKLWKDEEDIPEHMLEARISYC